MTYAATKPDVRVTGRRIVATFIDGIVFGLVNGALAWFLDSGKAWWDFDLTEISTRQNRWLFVIAALYYIVLEGLTGRTVGKLITGIRVVDAETGGRPGLLSGFVRTLARLIDGIAGYLVALIIVVNSKNRRRLGDMAAKTLVIRP
ncbi:RDD family protein [Nucisporomicrobium flavum]|jgi:uncharacterized RDD family membrane protein YckC|uniref:RDD family protein n=1 Tax=Nucisporomicrobium flavum TaxID=2785915 RepID=UPI0018F59B48|nr:RDD family protein [Nucisporomicrobium flavum]